MDALKSWCPALAGHVWNLASRFLLVICLSTPGAVFLGARPTSAQQACTAPGSTVELTYLGAAGWIISDGETSVLVDPYLTRLKYGGSEFWDSGDTRAPAGPDDVLAPDTALISEHIIEADYVLVHHTHFDHAHDVPFIGRRTGAVVIGTSSTGRLLRAYGIPERQIRIVDGAATLHLDGVTVRAIPALHTDFGSGVQDPPPTIPEGLESPVRLRQLVEGGSLMFEVRFGEDASIVTMGSMNFREEALTDLHPDVAIVGAHSIRSNVPGYTPRLLRALHHPPVVLPTHWDNYRVPYSADHSERWKTQVEGFIKEVRAASPDARVLRPPHLKPLRLDVDCSRHRQRPS